MRKPHKWIVILFQTIFKVDICLAIYEHANFVYYYEFVACYAAVYENI